MLATRAPLCDLDATHSSVIVKLKYSIIFVYFVYTLYRKYLMLADSKRIRNHPKCEFRFLIGVNAERTESRQQQRPSPAYYQSEKF